mmetsp:Transcript_74909/g.119130  ORF Transcript_74909/g.119130 Transcript_74909/m.119130 type:complete len:223 (+) Transcript_74909:170-838(+)
MVILQQIIDSFIHSLRHILMTKILQHQHRRSPLRYRIHLILSGNVRSRAMRRLKQRESLFIIDLRRRHQSQTTNHASQQITDQIPKQIGTRNHVEFLVIHHQFIQRRVGQLLIIRHSIFRLRIGKDFAMTFQEQTVRLFTHICFMHGSHHFASIISCILQCKVSNAITRSFGDAFDALHLFALRLHRLLSGIQILCVFTHSHNVHVLERRVLVRFRRTHMAI